MLQVIVRQIC